MLIAVPTVLGLVPAAAITANAQEVEVVRDAAFLMLLAFCFALPCISLANIIALLALSLSLSCVRTAVMYIKLLAALYSASYPACLLLRLLPCLAMYV